jgi:putative cell wall-binding protein
MNRNFSFLSFIASFLLVFTLFAPAIQAESTGIVDPNLDQAIKDYLGVESYTLEDLQNLGELYASEYGIENLTGLEEARSLTYLYLDYNHITNIQPLANLTQIVDLSLSGNMITDLSPLANYKNLSYLDLSYNEIEDISPLGTIAFNDSEWAGLFLAGNKITTLSALSSLSIDNVNEFTLDVSNNLLTSLDGIENLTETTALFAGENKLTSLSGLSNLENLVYLDVYGNELTSLDGLTVQEDIYYDFNFSYNKLSDISALKNLRKGNIDLSFNNISDISALKNMTEGTVVLYGNPLKSAAMDVIRTLEDRGINVLYDPIKGAAPRAKRLSGGGRYETAVRISQEGWAKANTVVIARADSFPDALAGAPLAYQLDAPILLTEKDKLTEATKKEIVRLEAKEAVILGGTSAVSEKVERSLKNMGLRVDRIAGSGRYETAVKIAEQLENYTGGTDAAVVAYGLNFPDALAAASFAAQYGFPILLTEQKQLPKVTESFIKKYGKTDTIIVGGEGVVGKEVAKKLPGAFRIGGKNRFETAAKMITELDLNPTRAFIANGNSFPDALTGSVLAAKRNAPLLLVETNKIPYDTAKVLQLTGVKDFTLLGGKAVIADSVANNLGK